jgi:hypothetical protein
MANNLVVDSRMVVGRQEEPLEPAQQVKLALCVLISKTKMLLQISV